MVGATTKAACSQLVVARIFMEQTWEYCRRHIGPDAVVGKRSSVAFPIGAPTLSPRFRLILRLIYCREKTVEGVGGPVEYTSGRKPELLPGGNGRERGCIFNGSVIRQNFEDAVVYGSGDSVTGGCDCCS